MAIIQAMNHFTVLSGDLDATRKFYGELMGLGEGKRPAFRFPGMVLSALVLWIVYVFGARAHSRAVGLFAAFGYALLPNAFYHAHLDCFDGPIVSMLVLVTYCYWRSLTSRREAPRGRR